jgi:hypothetical protein
MTTTAAIALKVVFVLRVAMVAPNERLCGRPSDKLIVSMTKMALENLVRQMPLQRCHQTQFSTAITMLDVQVALHALRADQIRRPTSKRD